MNTVHLNRQDLLFYLKESGDLAKHGLLIQYRKKLKEKGKKSLYVSLYGVTNYSEIEDYLFQQIHPFFASEGMVIGAKIFKDIVKDRLKINLYDILQRKLFNETKKLPKDSNFSLLIFDDLERCSINIEDLLGYINNFVDSQDLKVVIVANEDEIYKHDDEEKKNNEEYRNEKYEKYKNTKEKIIGKTFEISVNLQGALTTFLEQIENLKIKNFLLDNSNLIQELYTKSNCMNLRVLSRIILEFKRIFNVLPDKVKNRPDILRDILELLIIFSIETSVGSINSRNISQIEEKMSKEIAYIVTENLHSNTSKDKTNNKPKILFAEVFNKYYSNPMNNPILDKPFPDLLWWENFFNKGILDAKTLETTIQYSKYFQSENDSAWLRLMHFYNLNDNEFKILLDQVSIDHEKGNFDNIGVIKHVTGLLLLFSKHGIYIKSESDIISQAKICIDKLKDNKSLINKIIKYNDDTFGYMRFSFYSSDNILFKNFVDYIKQFQQDLILENISSNVNELLNIMKSDSYEFRSIICKGTLPKKVEFEYHEFPIFTQVPPDKFIEAFLILSYEDQRQTLYYIKQRYEDYSSVKNFVDELGFFKKVQELLLIEVSNKKGKLSGHLLSTLNDDYLVKIIDILEKNKNSQHQNTP